jgi:hypothetical protein
MSDRARKTPLETARIRDLMTPIAFHYETGNFILNARMLRVDVRRGHAYICHADPVEPLIRPNELTEQNGIAHRGLRVNRGLRNSGSCWARRFD